MNKFLVPASASAVAIVVASPALAVDTTYAPLFTAMGLTDLNTLFSSTGLVIVGLAAIGVGIALAVRFLKKGKSAA